MEQSRPSARGLVIIVALCCVVGMALAPGVLAQSGDDDEDSVGAQVSSFMQATAADANGTVDSGMWEAAFNDTDDPGQAVSQRADALEKRLAALERQSEALEAARANGSVSGVAYTARASAIHARLANLRAAVNQTQTTATRHGVNDTKLAELREAAGNATGPQIAAIARNLTNAGDGTPPWAGGPDEPGEAGGPPDDGAGDGEGNGTDGGQPDEPPGDGSGNDREGGPPDDGGNSGGSGDDGGDGGPPGRSL